MLMSQVYHRRHQHEILPVSCLVPLSSIELDDQPTQCSGEASCLENCVDRFLDSSLYIVRQIEAQKQQI